MTEILGLDPAGVDIVEGAEGGYAIEVTSTAGCTGLAEATGRRPAPHIARLGIERTGGAVDPVDGQELSRPLDDSVPAANPGRCQPPRPTGSSSATRRR